MSSVTSRAVGGSFAAPRVIRPGRPWLQTTFQLGAVIPNGTHGVKSTVDDAIEMSLRWLQQKFPKVLPDEAWRGQSFRLELPGQWMECVAIPELGTWSIRLEQPDAPYMDRQAVPGRVWTTDVALAQRPDSVGFGCRVACASLDYADHPITLTRPRVVVELALRLGLRESRLLENRPWTIQNEAEVGELFDLVVDPSRSLPVVVLTQPDRTRHSVPLADYVLDAEQLGRHLLGCAYVVKLPWELGYKWTEHVGKPWSVFLGAVRTYMPGLDFDADSPFTHPLALVDQILFSKNENVTGETAFTGFLVERIMQHAATKRVAWGDRIFLPDAKIKYAELARQKTQESGDWQKLYEDEIAALKGNIEQKDKEIDGYVDQVEEAERARHEIEAEDRNLRAQVNSLLARLAEKTGEEPDTAVPIPDSYEELPDWVAKHFAGRLYLHPRALRGIKDACYHEVSLVYRSLLLLANEYRRMRMGFADGKQAFEAGLGRLELRCSGSISKERAGEQGDTYYVRYPTIASPRKFLDLHVRKGSTKDDHYCMAIYFFWDDDTQQVIVGWLPSHLDNRMT